MDVADFALCDYGGLWKAGWFGRQKVLVNIDRSVVLFVMRQFRLEKIRVLLHDLVKKILQLLDGQTAATISNNSKPTFVISLPAF